MPQSRRQLGTRVHSGSRLPDPIDAVASVPAFLGLSGCRLFSRIHRMGQTDHALACRHRVRLDMFYCQSSLYVQFNGTTKDSPYFLGFLLTLVALLQILSADLSESLGREFMTREVGAAVLTTVCGLFMRQLLLSRDPSEEAQDRVFQKPCR
jgi:hypothetical protein